MRVSTSGAVEIAVAEAVFGVVVATLRVAVDGVAASATAVIAVGVVVAAAADCRLQLRLVLLFAC